MLIFAGFMLIFLVVLGLIISGISGNNSFEMACAVVLVFATAFIFVWLPDHGSPVSDIKPDTYKVSFVYRAGDNVSVGIEKPKYDYDKEEGLYLYQFPKKDFDGEIKTDAKKLTATKVITGEGTFNRYKLE